MNKILFVHMPKCAGISIRSIIEDVFPDKKVIFENSSLLAMPRTQQMLTLKTYQTPQPIKENSIVFGHIFPAKYIGPNTNDVALVTFLRNPLDRLISHYNFWKNSTYPKHRVWVKLKENDWSFYEFAMSEEMRNFYSQYFVNIPVSRFNFIGVYEQLDKSWARFCKAMHGIPIGLPHINRTEKKWITKEEITSLARSEIEDFHSEDYKIYDYAKSFMLPKVI